MSPGSAALAWCAGGRREGAPGFLAGAPRSLALGGLLRCRAPPTTRERSSPKLRVNRSASLWQEWRRSSRPPSMPSRPRHMPSRRYKTRVNTPSFRKPARSAGAVARAREARAGSFAAPQPLSVLHVRPRPPAGRPGPVPAILRRDSAASGAHCLAEVGWLARERHELQLCLERGLRPCLRCSLGARTEDGTVRRRRRRAKMQLATLMHFMASGHVRRRQQLWRRSSRQAAYSHASGSRPFPFP